MKLISAFAIAAGLVLPNFAFSKDTCWDITKLEGPQVLARYSDWAWVNEASDLRYRDYFVNCIFSADHTITVVGEGSVPIIRPLVLRMSSEEDSALRLELSKLETLSPVHAEPLLGIYGQRGAMAHFPPKAGQNCNYFGYHPLTPQHNVTKVLMSACKRVSLLALKHAVVLDAK